MRSAFDAFGGPVGAFGPRDGWGGGKSHPSHFAGGKPESWLLGKPAKGSQPARPGTGRGHECSAVGGRLGRTAAL